MIEIYREDCLKALASWPADKVVDLIVTSPPYNFGIDYNIYNDKLSTENYLDWIEQVGIACKSRLSEDGSFFINLGSKPSDSLFPFQVVSVLTKHFKLQNTIHWIKSIAVPDEYGVDGSMGHFKPINSKRYINGCHEYIFHLTKTGNVELDRKAVGVPYTDKSNIGRWKGNSVDVRCRGNTWYIPYKTIRNKGERPHPSAFPVELPEQCMKLHGVSKINLVMDPFNGIGNSALAAQRLGLNFVGYDIDQEYCDIAKRTLHI